MRQMKKLPAMVAFLIGLFVFSVGVAVLLLTRNSIAAPILLFGLLFAYLGFAPLWNGGLISLRLGRRPPPLASCGAAEIPAAFGQT